MDFLIKLCLLIVVNCSAVIMIIFTAMVLHVIWCVVIEKIMDVYRYASGKTKDNER